MPTALDAHAARLAQALRTGGPASARELRSQLGLGTATFTRTAAALRAELHAVGATRSLTYALRRSIPGLPPEIPVYELQPGGVRLFARLTAVAPRGWHVESPLAICGFYPDLPWFLHDLRPAGFLGRLVPRQHPELGLPQEIQNWSADHAMRWLHEWGIDTVGAFVVGDPALQRLLSLRPDEVGDHDRPIRYARFAESVMNLGVPGSSAAGEQPKFLAHRVTGGARRSVLVKFSPRASDPSARRTADLLRCEHHALQCLRTAGIPAAESEIVEADGRVFLEVARFDRQGEGRLGLVSLLSVATHHGADIVSWATAADDLARARVIDDRQRQLVHWLDRFGALIGNSDRHSGNLSFFFEDGEVGAVAPVYDMLPMAYAIRSGEFATPVLTAPTPNARFPGAWREAWAVARRFWGIVAGDAHIHEDLRRAATGNAAALDANRRLLDRLPAEG